MKFTPEVVAALAVLRNAVETDFERHRLDVLERDLTSPPVAEVIDDTHQSFCDLIFKTRKSGHYSTSEFALQRAVWSYYNGKIPAGHEIHHIDGNKANNNIDNLKCLTKSEHQKIHANVDKNPRRGSKEVFVCSVCGRKYLAARRFKNSFCSTACRMKHERATSTETRKCVICGKSFTVFKHSTQKCCSPQCGRILSHQHFHETRKCVVCGKEFDTLKTSAKKCCSQQCAGRLRWQQRR